MGLKGTHQLQVSADINLVGENIILERDTEILFVASRRMECK